MPMPVSGSSPNRRPHRKRAWPTGSNLMPGGVSREAVAMAVGFLERQGMAGAGADLDGARSRAVRSTEFGLHTRNAYFNRQPARGR
jgi:hypothetical protein